MTMHRTGLALLLAATCGLARAAAPDAAAELAQRLQAVGTLQADFTQTSQTAPARGAKPAPATAPAPAARAVQTVTGTLSARKPGLFRWEVRSPYQQLIVSDGKDVRVHDPDLMQMTVRPLGKAWGETPALLFGGDVSGLAREFRVERRSANGIDTFVLRPRARDAVFAHVDLQFKGAAPFAMQLQDSLGQRTDISFYQVRLNTPLAADLFRFTPPPGTDVVRE